MFCRLRPATQSAAECGGDGASVALAAEDGRRHSFAFDKVFGGMAPQAAVFAEVSELVQSALDGYQVHLPPRPRLPTCHLRWPRGVATTMARFSERFSPA